MVSFLSVTEGVGFFGEICVLVFGFTNMSVNRIRFILMCSYVVILFIRYFYNQVLYIDISNQK